MTTRQIPNEHKEFIMDRYVVDHEHGALGTHEGPFIYQFIAKH
jgi:hypothetical protein